MANSRRSLAYASLVPVPSRVLIVDDAADVRQLLRTALRFHGDFRVVGEAADGRSGILAAGATQPDVVVLDVSLPDLEGREVLTALRERAPRAKVVVYTGREAADAGEIADEVDEVVMKDADLDHLVAILAELGSGEPWTRLELADDPSGVSTARRLVRATCLEAGRPDLADEACLVASELVSNALVHAPGGCELRLRCGASALRIEVLDAGPGTPDPREASDDDEHGRGLQIVATLCFAWGVEAAEGDRKAVWGELV